MARTRWNMKFGSEKPRSTNRVRYLPNRLGSVLQRSTDGRPLVPRGEGLPHQLPGVNNSIPDSEDVPEGTGKQTHPAANRQSNSSGIHKQPGQDSPPSNHPATGPLDVVPGERKKRTPKQTVLWVTRDQSYWMLNSLTFWRILRHFPNHNVDLFASCSSFHLQRLSSWRPDPLVEATDTFLQE